MKRIIISLLLFVPMLLFAQLGGTLTQQLPKDTDSRYGSSGGIGTVPVIEDNIEEKDPDYTITASNGSGAGLGMTLPYTETYLVIVQDMNGSVIYVGNMAGFDEKFRDMPAGYYKITLISKTGIKKVFIVRR